MGRPERPIDPSAGPVQLFAFELRKLRQEGGLTYRELARRSGCSVTVLSEAAGGERLPTLRVARLYAEACGGDPALWEGRWHIAAAEDAAGAGQGYAECPYLGLATYEAENADRFFGRDRLIGELLDQLRLARLMGVFGPSGCGKSSLLRAGLIPAVREGGLSPGGEPPETRVLTPGAHPMRELAGVSGAGLVVVDQFEEVFTLCVDAEERSRFIEALVSGEDTRVVLGVRADFYGRCAEHPALIEALRNASSLVGPMNAGELREAIVKPASREGLTIEPALVATIVGEAGQGPGFLPHVSHALQETWRQRRGKAMTMTGYEAAGGVRGAIARTAEGVYTGFSPERQRLARRILLRLVALGEGTEDTRRRVGSEELGVGDPGEVAGVLERLAQARLVTVGEGTVEIAHEALIGSWPRLRDWLGADREGLRIHRRLTEGATTWEELGRDPGALFRGVRLATTREWAAQAGDDASLTPAERSFLGAGVDAEDAERIAAERRTRRLRTLAGGLAVLLVISMVTGLFAWSQRQNAVGQAEMARSRQLAREAAATAGTDVGGAARLAIQAYRTAPTEEARGSLLSLAGHQPYTFRLGGHIGAVSAVAFAPGGSVLASGGVDRNVILWDPVRRQRIAALTGHQAPVQSLAFSPDGRSIASGDTSGTVIVWDAARRTAVRTLTERGRLPVTGVGFSGDGSRLVAVNVGDYVNVWTMANGRRAPRAEQRMRGSDAWHEGWGEAPGLRNNALLVTSVQARGHGNYDFEDPGEGEPGQRPYEVPNTVLAVSPDGRQLVNRGVSPESFDVLDPVRYPDDLAELSGTPGEVRSLAFVPGGGRLISGDSTGATIEWDIHRRSRIATFTGPAGAVNAVAASPDGRLVVSAADDGIVAWDRTQRRLTGHIADVTSVAYRPDGGLIATSGADATARLWTLTRPVATLTARKTISGRSRAVEDGRVNAVAFSPDGRLLATGDTDASRIWDVATHRQIGTLGDHPGVATSIAFNPAGSLLATAVNNGSVVLWNAATRTQVASLRVGGAVGGVAFSPDGRLVAAGGNGESVALFNVADRAGAGSLRARSGGIKQVAFSPDGRLLAGAADNGDLLLWDVRRRSLITALRGHPSAAQAVAFSPDGRFVATGGLDHTVVMWEVADRTRWATLTGHSGPITDLAFSPDGATLLSASEDHTVIPWAVRPEAALKRLCELDPAVQRHC